MVSWTRLLRGHKRLSSWHLPSIVSFNTSFSLSSSLTRLNRSEVHRSIASIQSPQWETCKTWQQAFEHWELAYQHNTIFLVREAIWNTSSLTSRRMTSTPMPHLHIENSAAPCTPVSGMVAPVVQTLASGTPTTSLSAPKKRFPSVIVISDSEGDSEGHGKDDGNSDGSSEIEATYPVKIEKKYDCFEFTDDENGEISVRQTYDAATDTYFDKPAMTNVPSQTKASRATSLSHSKIHAPSSSGNGSDSERPSVVTGSRQMGYKRKRGQSLSPSKPTIKFASGIARNKKKKL